MSDHSDSDCVAIDREQDHEASRKLIYASILCFTFFLAELIGGLLSNSLALVSDSFHMLSDVSGFAISLASIWISSRPRTATHSFGFARAEILGALFSVLLIWVLTGILLTEAIDRIRNPVEINATLMLVTSCGGLFVNGLVLFILGGHSHAGHHHGHAHNIEVLGDDIDSGRNRMTKQQHSEESSPNSDRYQNPLLGHSNDIIDMAHNHENINIRAAIIHALGDALFSVGVIIASLVIFFKPEWKIVDPICTFIFSIIVLYTTLRILKDSIFVLMEATPPHIDSEKLKLELSRIYGVSDVHCFHVWLLSIGRVLYINVDCAICPFFYRCK